MEEIDYSDYLDTHYSACGMDDYYADKKEQDMEEKIMRAFNDYVKKYNPDYGNVSDIAELLSEWTGYPAYDIYSFLMLYTGGENEINFNENKN